jgi:hypothetical protein
LLPALWGRQNLQPPTLKATLHRPSPNLPTTFILDLIGRHNHRSHIPDWLTCEQLPHNGIPAGFDGKQQLEQRWGEPRRYTVKNDILMHHEEFVPWYTPEGIRAAQAGNLMGVMPRPSDRHAVDSGCRRLSAIGILDPSLQQVQIRLP